MSIGRGLQKLREKRKRGLLLKWCTDQLANHKIVIRPWVLMVEDVAQQAELVKSHRPEAYTEFELYRPNVHDVDEMISNEDGFRREYLEKAFANGQYCLAVRHQGRIVAYMWAAFDAIRSAVPPVERDLQQNEVYLCMAWTHPGMRGRSLLPWLRLHAYHDFAAMGRTHCYSITEAFNTPSIRFKQKLGGRIIETHLNVELFRRYSMNRCLRRRV